VKRRERSFPFNPSEYGGCEKGSQFIAKVSLSLGFFSSRASVTLWAGGPYGGVRSPGGGVEARLPKIISRGLVRRVYPSSRSAIFYENCESPASNLTPALYYIHRLLK
jgi:hypothetical protein